MFLPRDGQLDVVAYSGGGAFDKIVEYYPRPIDDQTIVGKAMVMRQVLQIAPILGNPEAPPGTAQYARDFGWGSIVPCR
jgi:hypothetical protein